MSYNIIFNENTSAYFNELSISNFNCLDLGIQNFFEIVKYIKIKLNVCSIKIDNESYSKILDILNKNIIYKNYFDLFLSYFKTPFEKGSDNFDDVDTQYLIHNWLYKDEQIMGLAYAYLNNSFSVSFNNGIFDNHYIAIRIIEENTEELCKIYNIASDKQISYFENLYINNKEIDLIESSIPKNEKIKKSIANLPTVGHHGTNVLKEYINKIFKIDNSKYIDYVISSASQNSKSCKFIRINSDNTIILRLLWTKEGLGLIIKTTGRNRREVEKLVSLLEISLPKG